MKLKKLELGARKKTGKQIRSFKVAWSMGFHDSNALLHALTIRDPTKPVRDSCCITVV